MQNRFAEFQLGVEAGSERFNRCEQMANELVEAKSPYATGNGDVIIDITLTPSFLEILNRQEQLRSTWQDLLEAVDERDAALVGAGEIHRYDVITTLLVATRAYGMQV